MSRIYKADLHIHSCLSPCASLEMSPKSIVETARQRGLDLIAITDHNSTLNCRALSEICGDYDDIDCLFGVEATSAEEVHCLCYFDDLGVAEEFGSFLYANFVSRQNDPERHGDQVYVNREDEILGEVELYLGGASKFGVDELLQEVHLRGGLFLPAHIDRPSFSLGSQFGYVPPDGYDGVEISRHFARRSSTSGEKLTLQNSENYRQITNSDSHYLESIAEVYTEFELTEVSITALRRSLQDDAFSIRV